MRILSQWLIPLALLVVSSGTLADLGSRTSSAGGVTVTVDSNGLTTGVSFGPEVRRLDPDLLAAQLMACVQVARADARRQVQDLVLDHASPKASH